MLNQEDIKNILALIGVAPIKGAEALTVGLLQQKLTSMLKEELPVTPKENGTNTKSK